MGFRLIFREPSTYILVSKIRSRTMSSVRSDLEYPAGELWSKGHRVGRTFAVEHDSGKL